MPLEKRLMTIAHRLSSQGATLELEMYVLDAIGEDVEGTRVNLGRVASALKHLAAEIITCAEDGG